MPNVFLGTSDFAVRVLELLAESAHPPALVVTPPARPAGRGRRARPSPAATAAEGLGIPVHDTADVNRPETIDAIAAAGPAAITTAAFGQIIKEPLLSSHPMLNVHPSLLPRWRGAAPIERAIMAGDAETGVCVMQVVAELDAGPVALVESAGIEPFENHGSLAERLAVAGARLLVDALELLADGRLELTPQHGAATYAEKIAPSERRLDPARPAGELARKVRALTPHIGAYLELSDDERLGVVEAIEEQLALPVGEVSTDEEGLVVGCSENALRLLRVKPAGGREMPIDAYLRGHPAPTAVR